MVGPRTAKDALLAELLGDMDQLLSRFETAQKDMAALQATTGLQRDEKTSQAARELEAAAAKFGQITTRSVDDFVAVANEALSKFIQRTNEIKELLDKPLAVAAPAISQAISPDTSHATKPQPWLLALVFAAGLLAGVAAMIFSGK